jgi:peptidoglycan hydrolase-like protein with peptidoglycan-binding domain
METVTVNAAALRRVLNALNGAGHEIRELQVIRNLPGEKSPIDVLIDEYNAAASIARQSENQLK